MRTVDAEEAQTLLEQGYQYLDVRSVPEFAQGHVPGAYNIPLLHATPRGMAPNTNFLSDVQKKFRVKDRLVVGCAAGGRSARACSALGEAGFTVAVNMDGGFAGRRDPATGKIVVQGWQARGYPVSQQPEPGHGYAELGA